MHHELRITTPLSYSHDTYLSPFTWRYGSSEMRQIWAEQERRKLWRRCWIALAEVQAEIGLVRPEQVLDLKAHAEEIDLTRALAIEAEIHHDLMAEVRTFAEQARVGGGIIHLGATSMDIEDNADVLRQQAALDLICARLKTLLLAFAEQIERWVDTACMAFTHIQPAEPTTVGYRLAQYAHDLLADYAQARSVQADLRGKGFKGAVGTSASYAQLLAGTGVGPAEFERRVMAHLNLQAMLVATQTYARKQDWRVLNVLAGIAATLHKFALDVRILASPPIGEWSEPFGKHQVGSSAMPFKRNPITAEKIDSLARQISALPQVAWSNAALTMLERTLDDSANRRTFIAEGFLASDEILLEATRLVQGLNVDTTAIARDLAIYGPFAATERVLMEAVKAGADRQAMHERIREHSLTAWAALRQNERNPLAEALRTDSEIGRFLAPARITELMDASEYVGDAPQRAWDLAGEIRKQVDS